MQRMIFDEDGKLVGVDGAKGKQVDNSSKRRQFENPINNEYETHRPKFKIPLKTSENLDFLKEREAIHDIYSKDYWSLYSGKERLGPLKFTNNKTQEDVVKEIVELSKTNKVIFLNGTCGSGKSAIALNVARVLGKSSIVVPVKALQRQYEEDYITKKHIFKLDGKRMKIAMITGKENHDSLIKPGISCADPTLPENIKITERNYEKLSKYMKENPFAKDPHLPLEKIRRFNIAPSNPYWSPILPTDYDLKTLLDARKKKYLGVDGKEYIFYHRKRGCSYYDQYLAYDNADAIIFNSAKYKSEIAIGRKPLTEVDIIDEADEFLDSFFQQDELNLTRLLFSLDNLTPQSLETKESINKIKELIKLEEKNKRLLGIQEDDVFHISDTKLQKLLEELTSNIELEAEISLDELSYSNKALEIAKTFKDSLKDIYLTYKKDEDGNIFARFVSANLSGKFQDLINKTKILIFMSGTLHSENIIKNIFGIKEFKIVNAEELKFGSTEISMTGKEFDCKYSNFKSKQHSREDYLIALSACIRKAKTPSLIHVNAFRDLPTEREKDSISLVNLKSSERLKEIQREDRTGKAVSSFKKGEIDYLFTTKCGRGVDFPGEICNSVIFTKYPNPNISDTFWKVLKKEYPNYFWEFYKDKAWREFLQKIYRALRFPEDHVEILSPDRRVLDAVRRLQTQ